MLFYNTMSISISIVACDDRGDWGVDCGNSH